jgi:hypothetical protein
LRRGVVFQVRTTRMFIDCGGKKEYSEFDKSPQAITGICRESALL